MSLSIEKIASQMALLGITGCTSKQFAFAVELWQNSKSETITDFVGNLIKSRPSTFDGYVVTFEPTIGKDVVFNVTFDIAPNSIDCGLVGNGIEIEISTEDIGKLRRLLLNFFTAEQVDWLLFAAATAIPDEFSR